MVYGVMGRKFWTFVSNLMLLPSVLICLITSNIVWQFVCYWVLINDATIFHTFPSKLTAFFRGMNKI